MRIVIAIISILIVYGQVKGKSVQNNITVDSAVEEIMTKGIPAYDCHSDVENFVPFSRNSNCEYGSKIKEDKKVFGQLLHIKKYSKVPYYACKIEMKIKVQECNYGIIMGGTQILVADETVYIKSSYDECRKIFEEQKYSSKEFSFSMNLQNNRGYNASIPLAGKTHEWFLFGTWCSGSTLAIGRKRWENVLAFANVKVDVEVGTAEFDNVNNQLVFSDDKAAEMSDYSAFHPDKGYVYWNKENKTTTCEDAKLFEMFRGELNKLVEEFDDGTLRTSYSYNHTDQEFFIITEKKVELCNMKMESTQADKIFFVEGRNESLHNFFEKIDFKNIDKDLVTSMQLSVLDNKIGKEINSLKNKLLTKLCKDEQNLNIDHFEAPGYFSMQKGEVAYIKKCKQVFVKFRSTKKCFSDIPVTYNNSDYFIKAHSHILSEDGNPTDCSILFPPQFKLNGHYFKIINNALEVVSRNPENIANFNKLTFEYKFNKKFGLSIFSLDQKKEMVKEIRQIISKESVQNHVVRAYQGYELDEKYHFFDSIFKKLSTWEGIKESSTAIFGFAFISLELIFIGWIMSIIVPKLFNLINIVRKLGFSRNILCFWSDSMTEQAIRENDLHDLEKRLTRLIEIRNLTIDPTYRYPTAPSNFISNV